ncbi:methyltransferase domain-containing protein [Dongia deserti]|uniref:methyltransferase domain-containing protein n=1 Tax=Dongia deserti TaxID=2268030 RepID=UPI000E65190E|nr:methyltransferase domain-containing protein [Dongia deserti]
MVDQISHDYDTAMLDMLQIIWGEGCLSPGGPQAVREIMGGIDLSGKRVLDIGCGIGGLDQVLVELGAANVMGVDVGAPLIARARQRVTDDRISFKVIAPEKPLPFADASFDIVFTKDAWLHVIDKRALLREVHRVLKPGGRLAGGDWMKGPGPFSADMLYFIELEGIPYHPTTLTDYGLMLHEFGFEDVKLVDTNAWYCDLAKRELARMWGELFDLMTQSLGAEMRDHFIEDWRMMTVVLDRGELRPGRLWARKS